MATANVGQIETVNGPGVNSFAGGEGVLHVITTRGQHGGEWVVAVWQGYDGPPDSVATQTGCLKPGTREQALSIRAAVIDAATKLMADSLPEWRAEYAETYLKALSARLDEMYPV